MASSPIPGRRTVLLSSVVLCLASTLLLLQFVAARLHVCSLEIVNGLGASSCVCWFVGFSLLIEWLVFHSFASQGPSRRALVGATLKLLASVLLCVQPFSGTLPRETPSLNLRVPYSYPSSDPHQAWPDHTPRPSRRRPSPSSTWWAPYSST